MRAWYLGVITVMYKYEASPSLVVGEIRTNQTIAYAIRLVKTRFGHLAQSPVQLSQR